MGKGQSKHGHCYVVNAHFNPLCQLEENGHCNGMDTPLTSKDSGLHLTPELSFTLSDDNKSSSEKNCDAKCDLQVYLPEGPINEDVKCFHKMDVNSEKADGEKSEKEENQAKIECSQEKNPEQQEFSFVLHNYNRDSMEKDDVEKVVVRSLCDALKSSLKLPVSGSHTLKVHLTVSPAVDKELQTENRSSSNESGSSDKDDQTQFRSGCTSKNNYYEKENVDFMLSFVPDQVKHTEKHTKCCEHDCLPKFSHTVTGGSKHSVSQSPHTKQSYKSSAFKQESQKWLDESELNLGHEICNGQFSPRPSGAKERRHRSRHQNHRDRNHPLNFAGSEMADIKMCQKQSTCDLRYANPAYYSPRLKEKSNLCHSVNQNSDFPDYRNHKKCAVNFHHKFQDPEFHSHVLKYKLLREAKNNMLDVSFDFGDLNGKPETESHHHRRSKSYDMNDCCVLNSPKVQHRDCVSVNSNSGHYAHVHIPQSPSRHHKHRHREREKNKQRAMQQVASWLEKEDLYKSKQKDCFLESDFHNQKGEVVERHEYHHVHEHHHYYHYVDS